MNKDTPLNKQPRSRLYDHALPNFVNYSMQTKFEGKIFLKYNTTNKFYDQIFSNEYFPNYSMQHIMLNVA